MTFDEYQGIACALRRRADATSEAIRDRMRDAARAAGLDPRIAGLHAHNAIVSRDYGHPWPEVNYHHVRRVLHLAKLSHEPHRIVDRVLQRVYERTTWTRKPS